MSSHPYRDAGRSAGVVRHFETDAAPAWFGCTLASRSPACWASSLPCCAAATLCRSSSASYSPCCSDSVPPRTRLRRSRCHVDLGWAVSFYVHVVFDRLFPYGRTGTPSRDLRLTQRFLRRFSPWVLVAGCGSCRRHLVRCRPRSRGPTVPWARIVERIGLGIVAVGLVGFLVTQRGWHPLVVAAQRLVRPWPLLCGVLLVVCVLAMRHAFGRRPPIALFGTTQRQNDTIAGWLYLSPNLIGFTLFFAGPLVFSLHDQLF